MIRITFEFHEVLHDHVAMTYRKHGECPTKLEASNAEQFLEGVLKSLPGWIGSPGVSLKGSMVCEDYKIVEQLLADLKARK